MEAASVGSDWEGPPRTEVEGEVILGDFGDAQMGDGGIAPTDMTEDCKAPRDEGELGDVAGDASRRLGGRPLFLFSAELLSFSEFGFEENLGEAVVCTSEDSEISEGGG